MQLKLYSCLKAISHKIIYVVHEIWSSRLNAVKTIFKPIHISGKTLNQSVVSICLSLLYT